MRLNLLTIISGLLLGVTIQTSLAAEVTLVTGSQKPYAIASEKSGIDTDIMLAALQVKGHSLKVEFVPYVKLASAMASSQADIYSPLLAGQLPDGRYLGHSHYQIQNSAVTLKGRPEIKTLDDLKGLRVIAFRGARQFLGAEYSAVVKSFISYQETEQHMTQNDYLFEQRADVSIGGIRFSQYARKLASVYEDVPELSYHAIFPALEFHPVFKDETLRDDFNAGLKQLIASGAYQKIIEVYTKVDATH